MVPGAREVEAEASPLAVPMREPVPIVYVRRHPIPDTHAPLSGLAPKRTYTGEAALIQGAFV